MARTEGQREWVEGVLLRLQQVRASLDSIEQTLAIPRIASGPTAPEWRARVDAAAGSAVEAAELFDSAVFAAAVATAGGRERVLELLQRLAGRSAEGDALPGEREGP